MKTETEKISGDVNLHRRSFLRYAGAGVATAGLLVAGCHKENLSAYKSKTGIDIGKGDLAILNYAYALEQLEAAFYIQVLGSPFTGMTNEENALLAEICEHEVIHREFFKKVLGPDAIPALTVDFSKIDFTSRTAVLGAAKAFEDTGVAAYDGVGYLIQNPDYLTIAGKIVSVEARHAAYIRDAIKPGDFINSDVVDGNGLNKTLTIAEVLKIANTYLKTKVSASNYNYVA